MNSNMMGILGIVLTGLALVMVVISLAIPYWLVLDVTSSISMNIGLWKTCTHISSATSCSDTEFTDNEDKGRAVKAFMLIAMIVILAALLVGILLTFIMKKTIMAFIAMGCDIFGAVCLLIAVAIFGDLANDSDNEDKLHACFYMSVIAMIPAIVGGILFFMAKPSAGVHSIS